MIKSYNRARLLLTSLILAMALISFSFLPVRAASLLNKSVRIGNTNGSTVTDHKFQFDITTSTSVGSIGFEYCDSPLFDDPCNAPSGLDVSGASIASQSGETGFSIHPNTVSNRIVITRAPSITSPGTVIYDFSNITNPDTPNQTTYIRISTYPTVDGTGAYQDKGVAAFSITPSLGVNVYVPPYLAFCTAISVGLHCDSAGGLDRDLGTLKSSATSSTTTQFAGATNDNTGYSVSVLGTTMTSGNDVISNLKTPAFATSGVQQFGINLKDNSRPNIGHNAEGPGTLTPVSSYGSVNLFKFNSGDVISAASSATDYNRMTVTYIVNIKPGQPPGVYSTTLTYVAVASF